MSSVHVHASSLSLSKKMERIIFSNSAASACSSISSCLHQFGLHFQQFLLQIPAPNSCVCNSYKLIFCYSNSLGKISINFQGPHHLSCQKRTNFPFPTFSLAASENHPRIRSDPSSKPLISFHHTECCLAFRIPSTPYNRSKSIE